MRRSTLLVVLGSFLVVFAALSAAVLAAEAEPKVGLVLGSFKFAKVHSPEDQKYLGLDKEGPFGLADIKSPYVLLESFNTTCPHCMAQAPVMNNLFKMVESDAQLKGKIKFIAAGQANNEQAVQMWKKFHKIPFPVVADQESALGKAMNFSPYPVSLLVDKSGKVLWVHIGSFESADEALKGIKAVVK